MAWTLPFERPRLSSLELDAQSAHRHPTLGQLLGEDRLGLVPLAPFDPETPIRTAYVSELPDPSKYLRGQELVLTNGLWRTPSRDDRAYVKGLTRSGVSALGFGLTRTGQRAPQTIVTACRGTGLPLVQVPAPVAFSEVGDALSSLAMSEVRRSIDQAETFLRHAVRGGALHAILHTLTRARNVSAWCMAGPLVVASTPRPPSATDAGLARSVARNPHRSLPLTFTRDDDTTATVFGIRPTRQPATVLVYGAPFHSLGAEERTAIDQAISVLALEFDRREEHDRLKRAYTRELIELVMDGEYTRAVAGRLNLLGLPEARLRVLCIRLVEETSQETGELSLLLVRLVELILAASDVRGTATGMGREVFVLTPEADQEATHRLAALIASIASTELTMTKVGIGSGEVTLTGGDLHSSLVQARYSARRPTEDGSGALAEWHEISSHRALVEMHDPAVLRSFAETVLGPLLAADRRRNSCLVETLRRFFAARERHADCAAMLKIHVNTLRQRLERICVLTGRSLVDPASRVDLFIAINIYDSYSLEAVDAASSGDAGAP